MRARYRECYHFCCHKCHGLLYNTLHFNWLALFLDIFKQTKAFTPRISTVKRRKTRFPHCHFLHFLPSILCSPCDTCDSKKSTSLLERAHYAYARERLSSPKHFPSGVTLGAFRVHRPITPFWEPKEAYQRKTKKVCHFSAIFSLFGAISTHIHIGTQQGSARHSSPQTGSWLLNRMGLSVPHNYIRQKKTWYCVIPLHFCPQHSAKTCNNA